MSFILKTDKDAAAKLISSNTEAFDAFEQAYKSASIEDENDSFFGLSAKGAIKKAHNLPEDESQETVAQRDDIISRITEELLSSAAALPSAEQQEMNKVTKEEIMRLPKHMRPQLTSELMQTDIQEPPSFMLLNIADMALHAPDMQKKRQLYGMFRNGMETLDLDAMVYEMLGKNPNSMGNWFPALKSACEKEGFFKIPDTKIIKVPLPILQLSRLEYESLTPTTLKIVDEFCMQAFELDVNKSYFVKTGVFSAKYDFRNAKVTGKDEVLTLGEYLLYISNLAVMMMSPLNNANGYSRYGAACTNEWVVREFIEDKEGNPCIYHGLPLHTEYRVFIDCDSDEILGIAPYWRPAEMKARFGEEEDRDTPDMVHDYIVYTAHEKTLMSRYEKNKDLVLHHVKAIIKDIGLHGQWSLDIMQNGEDFWAIDMAQAHLSALNDCVPKHKLVLPGPDVESYLPVGLPIESM